jgi:acetylornithine deacetylase/succinyl-diaminopimelate desuccinylase-like protein
VDEEPGGNGTLAACLDADPPDAAIVLEPTGLHVAYGHRGIIGLRVTAGAEAGHAAVVGRAPRGAIARAAEAIRALGPALEGWASVQDEAYGPPSLNVGRIAGGEDIFSVPRRCSFEIGLRYAPGTAEGLMAAVRAALAPLGASWDEPTAPLRAEIFSHYDAAETPPEHPLTQGLLLAARLALSGRDAPTTEDAPRLTAFPGGCDARHFANRLGVPTVVFGPGALAAAHAVDEALEVEELLAAARTLACFITAWCGTAG